MYEQMRLPFRAFEAALYLCLGISNSKFYMCMPRIKPCIFYRQSRYHTINLQPLTSTTFVDITVQHRHQGWFQIKGAQVSGTLVQSTCSQSTSPCPLTTLYVCFYYKTTPKKVGFHACTYMHAHTHTHALTPIEKSVFQDHLQCLKLLMLWELSFSIFLTLQRSHCLSQTIYGSILYMHVYGKKKALGFIGANNSLCKMNKQLKIAVWLKKIAK